MEEKKQFFCTNCGEKLNSNAKFCQNCGTSVTVGNQNEEGIDSIEQNKVFQQPDRGAKNERKTVYEGEIHKCPNCGDVIDAYEAICETCGYEIRGRTATSVVHELSLKLEEIEAQVMPTLEEKKSIMKTVFGRDFKKEDEVKEAQNRFDKQKANQKANLITNFSVPNTKEDILEFMILAASNIDVKKDLDDEVTKAWVSKLEQVYQKAEISLTNTPDFAKIKAIYDKKQQEIRVKKNKGLFIGVGCVAGYFFLSGLYWNPIATISIAVFVIIAIIVGYKLFKRG